MSKNSQQDHTNTFSWKKQIQEKFRSTSENMSEEQEGVNGTIEESHANKQVITNERELEGISKYSDQSSEEDFVSDVDSIGETYDCQMEFIEANYRFGEVYTTHDEELRKIETYIELEQQTASHSFQIPEDDIFGIEDGESFLVNSNKGIMHSVVQEKITYETGDENSLLIQEKNIAQSVVADEEITSTTSSSGLQDQTIQMDTDVQQLDAFEVQKEDEVEEPVPLQKENEKQLKKPSITIIINKKEMKVVGSSEKRGKRKFKTLHVENDEEEEEEEKAEEKAEEIAEVKEEKEEIEEEKKEKGEEEEKEAGKKEGKRKRKKRSVQKEKKGNFQEKNQKKYETRSREPVCYKEVWTDSSDGDDYRWEDRKETCSERDDKDFKTSI